MARMRRPTRTALGLLAALPLAAAAVEPPLTLDDALASAAAESHELELSRADAHQAGADATGAWQGLLPRLDFTASVGHQYSGPTLQVASFPAFNAQGQPVVDPKTGQPVFQTLIIQTPYFQFQTDSAQLVLSQPLFDGFATWNQVASARAGVRAAARSYDEARLTVAFDVIRRFYELVKGERSLQVLEAAAARSAELVGRADALYAAARAPKADTFTARVNLGNDRIAVEQARTRIVQARADLAVALGRPGDDPVEVVAPTSIDAPGIPGGEPPPLDALLLTAKRRRPALAAALAQIEEAEASVGVARAAYWPTLSAQVNYLRNGTALGGAGGVWANPSQQYSTLAQVVMNWNLFSGRATDAAVARAEAAAERTRATAARTADGVAREVAEARQNVVALTAQLALAAENLAAAEQGLALARDRLEAGLASQLEVRDASLKLTQSQLSVVQARVDRAVAVADLNRSVGGAL